MTHPDFWLLPGPQRFLGDSLNVLGTGRSLVLRWPPTAPDLGSLMGAVREGLRHDDLDLAILSPEAGTDPLLWMSSCFLPHSAQVADTVFDLLERAELPSTVLWLSLPDDASTGARWVGFLQEFAHGTTHLPLYGRPRLILPLPSGAQSPLEDSGLAVMSWKDVLDSFDVFSHAMALMRPRFTGHRRNLYAQMLSQIALFDVLLLEQLAEQTEEVILAPDEFLLEVGRERGYCVHSPRNWHLGTEEQFDGQLRLHSSLKVQDGGVGRRLWRAQVNVLHSLLEERRQSFVVRFARHLTAPIRVVWSTNDEVVNELGDLEFKHLVQLARSSPNMAFRNESTHLAVLRDVRNKLSHLTPLAAEELSEILV